MSDLHLEVVRFPWRPMRRPEFDVLAVAGDVRGGDPAGAVDWVADLAQGRPSVMVLGNHEPWQMGLDEAAGIARARARERGVVLLDGTGWVDVGGVFFTGCTLWTDQALNQPFGRRIYEAEYGEPILDADGDRISGAEMLARHASEAEALGAALGSDALPDGPRVAMTHHAPSIRSVGAAWRRHPAAGLSASDLDHLLAAGTCDAWIHGHVHESADYVPFGHTRVVCNPFGYHGSNARFDEGLVIGV